MTKEKAINYLRVSGFSKEQRDEIIKALETRYDKLRRPVTDLSDQYRECMKLELLKQIADNLARIADILEGKEAGNEVDHRQNPNAGGMRTGRRHRFHTLRIRQKG